MAVDYEASAESVLHDCQGQPLCAIFNILEQKVKELTLSSGQTEDATIYALHEALGRQIKTYKGNVLKLQEASYWYAGMNLL